jgi:hypothetical protein
MKPSRCRLPVLLALSLLLSLRSFAADTDLLPEITIDLSDIAPQQCLEREWRLAHSAHQIVICSVEPGEPMLMTDAATDASELISQAVKLRESTAYEALAESVLAMQQHLDALAQRSLDARWRVFINHGAGGCRLTASPAEALFTDPCTTQRYDAEGRPMAEGYPALAIPPHSISGNTVTVGRLPPRLAVATIPLPPLDLDAGAETTAEYLIRVARWGDTQRAAKILASGVDINSRTQNGTTALLIAVQRRQSEMVAFLLDRGADVTLAYPDGTGPLEMAELVAAPEIAAMLMNAGASAMKKDY